MALGAMPVRVEMSAWLMPSCVMSAMSCFQSMTSIVAVANTTVNRCSEQRFKSLPQTQYMEAIKSRLKRLLDKCGTSRRQIGLLTGISRSHLSELESGGKDLAKLACGQMLALCAELSTTPEYLLYEMGAEDMDERSRLEQEMLSVFRRASEEDQRKIIGSARGIVGDNLLGNEEAA